MNDTTRNALEMAQAALACGQWIGVERVGRANEAAAMIETALGRVPGHSSPAGTGSDETLTPGSVKRDDDRKRIAESLPPEREHQSACHYGLAFSRCECGAAQVNAYRAEVLRLLGGEDE